MKINRQATVRGVMFLAAMTIVLTSASCGGTRARRTLPEESGFLRDYSKLKEDENTPAKLTYFSPNALWRRYTAIWIESVSFWASSDTSKLSPEDRQMLTDFFYKALHDELSKEFRIASGPGSGVLQFRAAITEAKGANVPLKAVTTIVPQLKLVSTVVGRGCRHCRDRRGSDGGSGAPGLRIQGAPCRSRRSAGGEKVVHAAQDLERRQVGV